MQTTPTEPSPTVKTTWKPTTAGILSMVAGVIDLVTGIALAATSWYSLPWYTWGVPLEIDISTMVIPIVAFGVISIVLGIIALVGGIFSVQRRLWGLGLAGAICALLPQSFILGILSIIFLAMGKKEFN